MEEERTKTLNKLRRTRIGQESLLKKPQKDKENLKKTDMQMRVIQFNIRATPLDNKQLTTEKKKEEHSEVANQSRELSHQAAGFNFGRSKGSLLDMKQSTDRNSPTSRQIQSSSTPKIMVKTTFRVNQPPAADESYFSKYNNRRKSRNKEIELTLSNSQETHRKKNLGSFKESVHQSSEEKKMLKILDKKQREPVIRLDSPGLNSYAAGGLSSALLESLNRDKQAPSSKQLNLKAIEVPKSKMSMAGSRRSESRSSRQHGHARSDPSQSPSVSIAVEDELKSRVQTNASRSESRKTKLLLKRNSSFDRRLILKRLQVIHAHQPLVKKLEFYKRSFRSNSPSSKSVRSHKKSREKIAVEDAFCIEVNPEQIEQDPVQMLSAVKHQPTKQAKKKSQPERRGKQLLGFKSEIKTKDQLEQPRSPVAAALRRSVIVKPKEKPPKDENYLNKFTTGLMHMPKSFLQTANLQRQKSQDKPTAKIQPAKLKDYSSPSIKKHLEHTLKSFKSKV